MTASDDAKPDAQKRDYKPVIPRLGPAEFTEPEAAELLGIDVDELAVLVAVRDEAMWERGR